VSAGGRPPAFFGAAMSMAMRTIDLIAIHCTATLEGRPFNVAAIRAMHMAPPNKWSDIGYHRLIGIDGERWAGRVEGKPGAHIQGHNANSIAICYVGGIGSDGKAKDTRTPSQLAALEAELRYYRKLYPTAKIRGHRDLSPDKDGDGKVEPHEWLKMCPCFDVVAWCKSVGIDPR
jgi:N-acetylmuramoyl-L-alanine amidase